MSAIKGVPQSAESNARRREAALKWRAERGLAPAKSLRQRYAERLAAGVCTRCGGPKAEGDGKLCAPCRDYHNANAARARARDREQGGPPGSRHRVDRKLHDRLETPREPLLRCRGCYDLPWRRAVAGCPACGQPWGPLDHVHPSDTAAAREHERWG